MVIIPCWHPMYPNLVCPGAVLGRGGEINFTINLNINTPTTDAVRAIEEHLRRTIPRRATR